MRVGCAGTGLSAGQEGSERDPCDRYGGGTMMRFAALAARTTMPAMGVGFSFKIPQKTPIARRRENFAERAAHNASKLLEQPKTRKEKTMRIKTNCKAGGIIVNELR